ncbi:MAG: tRNA (cytidine(34)-2'-O)-methyltransferase [Planctomycetota bacterium]|nr:tRNA (cytidine(34)-2'-O)-methyltransferase [Planctomycetota bacterium]
MHVVLVHPEIPQNTGAIGRLTAAFGAHLHLVEPLGFSLDERRVRRAGLDYWHLVDLTVHPDLEECFGHLAAEGGARPLGERLRLFTARAGAPIREAGLRPDDVLVFGAESDGLPEELVEAHRDRLVRIPIREGVRSINLSNAVAIALFAAGR